MDNIQNIDLVLNNKLAVEEIYKFTKALLADYNACKTELARNGLMKSVEIMLDRIADSHAKTVEERNALASELEAIKTSIKTKFVKSNEDSPKKGSSKKPKEQ